MLSTAWNTIPTEFSFLKKEDYKGMYILNDTYIFVRPLGRTNFINSFFKAKLCQKRVPETLLYLLRQSEWVHGESVIPKMGTDCIPNGRLKKYAAKRPHISF